MACPPQGGLPHGGSIACPPQGGLSHGAASPPQGGLPHLNTFVVNQTVLNNDGCNFGTVTANTRNETNVAVENVVQLAEARHYNTVVHLAETANHEHLQQMANLTREAQLALHRQAEEYTLREQHLQREAVIHAEAQRARVNQLEMALELQENKIVQILAQKEREREEMVARAWRADHSPEHSSPGSANYHDVMSNSGSVRAQPGFPASLAAGVVNPFANTFWECIKGFSTVGWVVIAEHLRHHYARYRR